MSTSSARPPFNAAPPASSATVPVPVPVPAQANTVSNIHQTLGQVENTGRWTAEEHRLFLQGLEQHGKGWKDIGILIQSRTVVQIRTHAQKYFQKLAKARQNGENVVGVGMDTAGGAVMTSVPPGHNVQFGSAEGGEKGITIPVGLDGQPVVTMRTNTHPNSSGNHHGNMSLGNDPASLSAARSQVGISTAAGIEATGGAMERGRKRHNTAPGRGTKRRASPLPAVSNVLDPYFGTTTMGMRPPLLVAGTAASATAKKNGWGCQQMALPMAALEDAVFRLLTPATGAPSPLMQRQYHNSFKRNAIVDPLAPSNRIPIAHTKYLPLSTPAPASRTTYPIGVADMFLLRHNDGSDIDTLLEDADCLNWHPTGGVVHPSTDSLSFLVDPPAHNAALPQPVTPTAHEEHVEDLNQSSSVLDEDAYTPLPLTLNDKLPPETTTTVTTTLPYSSATEAVGSIVPEHKPAGVGESDTNFMGFPDLDMGDEEAFVSALLENPGQSTMSFPNLHGDLHMSQANMSSGKTRVGWR